jgi:hypothetical protein
LYIVHQNLIVARREPGAVKYGYREAVHAARDRFTPRFVHRHSDEEVCGWFHEAGYEELQCASRRGRPDYVPIAFTAAAGVDGHDARAEQLHAKDVEGLALHVFFAHKYFARKAEKGGYCGRSHSVLALHIFGTATSWRLAPVGCLPGGSRVKRDTDLAMAYFRGMTLGRQLTAQSQCPVACRWMENRV